MTAYNEENFNKLLDAFTEIKNHRDALLVVSSRLHGELVKEHHYTEESVACVIGGTKAYSDKE